MAAHDGAKRIARLDADQRRRLAARLQGEPVPAAAKVTEEKSPETKLGADPDRGMAFSLFFFSDSGTSYPEGKYQLLLESARFADQHGFSAVWTPERHFHEFGGPYPNPAVLGAALAMVTERLEIRAGSVVVPLHHPVRIAEEWAVVDNLSGGRVGLSVASGWNPDDFLLAREGHAHRREVTFRDLESIQRLWAGDAVGFPRPEGEPVEVRSFPRPVRADLPIWVTSASNPNTWVRAGELGTHVLTGLMEQSVEDLAANIALYRRTLTEHGHDPGRCRVSAMVHTFVGQDEQEVLATVRPPMISYLENHMGLYERLVRQSDLDINVDQLSDGDRAVLIEMGFQRYCQQSGLFGTPESCLTTVERLRAAGVDEIACLIDFGLDFETALQGLDHLNELRRRSAGAPALPVNAAVAVD